MSLTNALQQQLLHVAKDSIQCGLEQGHALVINRKNHAYPVVSQNIYLLHNSASTELCMCRTLEHWAKT